MSSYKNKQEFFATEEGIHFIQSLKAMVADRTYKTDPTYSANSTLYPNNLIPFVDKHKFYLSDHPSTNPGQYLSNLRIVTRIR